MEEKEKVICREGQKLDSRVWGRAREKKEIHSEHLRLSPTGCG